MTEDMKHPSGPQIAGIGAILSILVAVFAILGGWKALGLWTPASLTDVAMIREQTEQHLNEIERGMLQRYERNAVYGIDTRAMTLDIAIAELSADLANLQADRVDVADPKALRQLQAAEERLSKDIARFQVQLNNLALDRQRLLNYDNAG